MTILLRCTLAFFVPAAFASAVQADNCTALAGKQVCVSFHYSTRNSNRHTAQFNADGTFTLPFVQNTAGTWRCAGGLGLVDVEYLYGGTERQSWYGVVAKGGDTLTGNGLAPDAGYMYELASVAGACAGGKAGSLPGATQAE